MSTYYSGTTKEIRALNTYIKMMRATHTVQNRINAHGTIKGLSSSQFGALEMLYHLGPLHQNMIGSKLLASKSNVVGIIDVLEKKGLVKRHQDKNDRRLKQVHITSKGKQTIEPILKKHVAAITKEFGCLTDAEQNELARLCKKLGLNGE